MGKTAITSKNSASEIDNLLQQLLLQIQSILDNNFIGMYIGGSIANDSFNPVTSDIDCYIITSNMLPGGVIHKLEELHKKFYSSQLIYANKIEASYIPRKSLLDFNPSSTRPYFNEGNFYLAPYGSNFIIELFMLRKKGIKLVGPDIKNLIKEISIQDLHKAIKKNLYEYWELALNDLLKLKRSDYQVFAILTMCRTIYSLDTGDIGSKVEAAQWVINNYSTNWMNLIEEALSWRPGFEFNKLEETQQFIRYVLDISFKDTAKTALIWITDILKNKKIPFQISGGLAAIAYGANRPLADIDIDITDNQFDIIKDDIGPYIIYGPARFKSDKWDLTLMTLNYQGQEIDLSDADSTHIFNEKTAEWIKLNEDLRTASMKKVLGLDMPVISLQSLIYYKKILAREVDLIDISQIEKS